MQALRSCCITFGDIIHTFLGHYNTYNGLLDIPLESKHQPGSACLTLEVVDQELHTGSLQGFVQCSRPAIKDQLERYENKRRGTTNGTGRKKSYGGNLGKEEKLDRSYTQRRKPAEGGDKGSDDRKKTKGRETTGYVARVSERIVICGTKENGGKQKRVENIEAKNLPNSSGRFIITEIIYTRYKLHCIPQMTVADPL